MPAERTTMRQVREVLRLKFVGGVPIREIARRIGVAASTVRVTLKTHRDRELGFPDAVELAEPGIAVAARVALDVLVPEDRQRDVLALELPVDGRPVGLDLTPVTTLGAEWAFFRQVIPSQPNAID